MCFKPFMIHYTLNSSNIPFFNVDHSKWSRTYSHKKQVMLYNTFNIHENSTLPLLIQKYKFFCLRKLFKFCNFNDQKHI
jgi:hypothetical protein